MKVNSLFKGAVPAIAAVLVVLPGISLAHDTSGGSGPDWRPPWGDNSAESYPGNAGYGNAGPGAGVDSQPPWGEYEGGQNPQNDSNTGRGPGADWRPPWGR